MRTIAPEQIAAAARRFKLPLETVSILAERIVLEFDARGYRSAPSALLNWCQREAANPMIARTANGADHRDGDREGSSLIWFHGAWRSAEAAEFLGWMP